MNTYINIFNFIHKNKHYYSKNLLTQLYKFSYVYYDISLISISVFVN